MKVIFLDVDGVLNAVQRQEISQEYIIDEEKVDLLGKIVKATDAVLVMHSGWRFWFDEDLRPLRKEAENLEKLLSDVGLSIYAKTPDFTTEKIRKNKTFGKVKPAEILAWLEQNTGVDSWIVLEDLDLRNEEIRRRQIQTNGAEGLTERDVIQAIELLKGIN